MLEVPINDMRVITNALKPIFASAVTCSLLVLLIGCINYGGGPDTDEIEIIEKRNKPTWLPPEPFLSLGIKTRLIYERIRARSDI